MANETTHTIGRRKRSTARVFLTKGTGQCSINGKTLDEYFHRKVWGIHAREPLVLPARPESYDRKVTVKGGGLPGQAGAVRLGIARALVEVEPDLRPSLKAGGFMTRDPREVERKKPGQPGARKRFQFSKR